MILCTTSCTPDWSNLPVKTYFLPLLHRIIYYMGGSAAGEASTPVGMAYRLKIRDTGQPVTVKFHRPPTEQELADEIEPKPVEERSNVVRGENSAVFNDADRPGIYRAQIELSPNVSKRRLFAVNVPQRESALDRFSFEEAREILPVENLVLVRDPTEIALIVRREREGLPLWDYLLALTLVVAVVETYVANVMLKH